MMKILIFFLAAILFLVLYTLLLKRSFKKNLRRDIQKEINDLIRSMNEATERNIYLIENKIGSLKTDCRRAEELLEELRMRNETLRSAVKREQEKSAPSGIPRKKESASASPERLSEKNKSKGERAVSTLRPNLPERSGISETPELNASVSPEAGGSASGEKDELPENQELLQEKIIRLHRQGIAPQLIAESLGCPQGEAELVISLYESRNTRKIE